MDADFFLLTDLNAKAEAAFALLAWAVLPLAATFLFPMAFVGAGHGVFEVAVRCEKGK